MDTPPLRAIIVDDDLTVSRLMWRCLSMWGWGADECHSVSEALGRFKNGEYDLALCDVDLPDGNGIILAKALSKAKPSLRVVVISGNPMNAEHAREAGLTRFLRKPFELDALKALIDSQQYSINKPLRQ
ncbi:MAG: response regulator [Elusimicrobiota bacterium]|nr:response regulator [Elusimicrobiota bacterium]